MKAKTTKVVLKEIRFGPNTDEHDYDFKMKHAQKFIEEGAKVKAFVFFKGRSILFKEKGTFYLYSNFNSAVHSPFYCYIYELGMAF